MTLTPAQSRRLRAAFTKKIAAQNKAYNALLEFGRVAAELQDEGVKLIEMTAVLGSDPWYPIKTYRKVSK